MKKIAMIINLWAGQGRVRRQWGQIDDLRQRHRAIDCRETRSPGDATVLATAAAHEGYDVVIAVGGDGTVNETINGLMCAQNPPTSRPRLGVLPLGSANDFARGLHLLGDLPIAFSRILSDHTASVDLGYIAQPTGQIRYFGFSTGLGFVGMVAAKRFHTRHLRGALLYFWAALQTIREYGDSPCLHVQFDEEGPVTEALLFVSVNNTATVGGFPLTPHARMDDGFLDVIYLSAVDKIRMLQLLLKAKRGAHLQEPEFRVVRTRRLSIGAPASLPLHIDGEVNHGTATNCLEIGVLPRALQVIV
jgi:diacylglycerol kinase (ATP)